MKNGNFVAAYDYYLSVDEEAPKKDKKQNFVFNNANFKKNKTAVHLELSRPIDTDDDKVSCTEL